MDHFYKKKKKDNAPSWWRTLAITFNNRICAKLRDKEGGWKLSGIAAIADAAPEGALVFLFDLFFCHLVCSQWAVVCLLGTALLSAEWETEVGEIALWPSAGPFLVHLLTRKAIRPLKAPGWIIANLIFLTLCDDRSPFSGHKSRRSERTYCCCGLFWK